MLTLSGIHKAFGQKTLFSDASLQINRQDRIGLVGPNGVGKSTLFNMILGQESPDDGKILLERNVSFGFLPQESAPAHDESVLELASAITPEFAQLKKDIQRLDANPDLHDEFEHSPHAHYAELNGHQVEAKAKKILAGLSFRESDHDRPAREMSGGWVMRAHLARLLVQEPDLLMLDEPTNHLDLETLIWFQGYLKKYPGAILVISHDRSFLNYLIGSIVEIRQHKLIRYVGDYEEFLVQREAQEAQLLAAYRNQQKEIDRLMLFVNRFRAKNTKAAAAQSKLKQIDRMDKIQAPVSDDREIQFNFPQPARSGLKAIALKDLHHAYGPLKVYQGIDFQVDRGQRTVLVGPNGAGKSTLLKILAGVLEVQQGTRTVGHNVRIGYYSQYRAEVLHENWTVLEEALDTPQPITEQFARTLLGGFLFQGDDVFKKVKVLSGGEKSRLALVKILLDPPNLLLMDEPTTHLDMNSIDALLAALDQYNGTLVFISHDVYFIRSLANHVVHVHSGQLTHYPGGYQYYLDKTATQEREGLTAGQKLVAPTQGSPSSNPDRPKTRSKEQKRLEAEERQNRYRRRKKLQTKVDGLEKQIEELEARQTQLTQQLEDPQTYEAPGLAQKTNRELAEVTRTLQAVTQEWESDATKLADL